MTPSLNAIVPMACVTAAGIASMVAESFRDPGERMPIAGLGVVGLLGAAFATVLLWNHNASSFGVVAADNFGLFVTGTLIVVGLLSLAVYVLTGIRRDSPASTEAAFKYFLLGAFASAFFLYGIAFTYGLTGSTRLDRIGSLMAAQAMAPTPMTFLALGLIIVGFASTCGTAPPPTKARRRRSPHSCRPA